MHPITSTPLILASGSPRRRMLLEEAGYTFTVMAPPDSVERQASTKLPPLDLVAKLAFVKARHVAHQLDKGMVLAADTVAECDGQTMGKPSDRQHAETMLRMLSGRTHSVLTGVCLWNPASNKCLVDVSCTQLQMDSISDLKLENHLDSGRWKGKAGAFGFQDGNDWLKVIEGSESNVVGLPMERLYELLSDFDRLCQDPPAGDTP